MRQGKGETESGGKFGSMTKTGASINRRKNVMMSALSNEWPKPTAALIICHHLFETECKKMPTHVQNDWLTVLRLAEVGANAVLNQLKESAEILREAGIKVDGRDGWTI